jgi:putative thioredoxin
MAATDVTDANFESDVIQRSFERPVVVDLWAPWCGPCTSLGPIIEESIDATSGQVELVKVNIDENPSIAQAFRVQSIPAVFALKDGQVVDGFVGAYPKAEVDRFVSGLLPTEAEQTISSLIAAGDEASLSQVLELEPGNEPAILALAQLFVDSGRSQEALVLLGRIPESEATRRIAAAARLADQPDDDHDATLTALLEQVRDDDDARQRYVDILELMGPDDERTAQYRKKLTNRLF